MTLAPRIWLTFILLSFLSAAAWIHFSLPQFTRIDLSISREQARTIAKKYLQDNFHVNPNSYLSATILGSESTADRYLQRAIGFEKERQFLDEHNFELFYWIVRFFKEGQKEEFRLKISSKTGEILSHTHALDDAAVKPEITEEEAKSRAVAFLKERFNINMDTYTLHANSSQKYDKRRDFFFVFRKEGVYIPWSTEKDTGGAKLLTSVTVSGNEISAFARNGLEIPDQFNRDIAKRVEAGKNLSLVFRIIYLVLFIGATLVIIIRRNHIAMNTTKRLYIGIAVLLFVVIYSTHFNYFEFLLYDFPTTSSLKAFITRNFVTELVLTTLFVVGFMMPALAGELFHHELMPKHKEGSFLYYVHSSFWTKDVCGRIFLGYFAAVIMLGLQTVIFELGYRYAGVWSEQKWLSDLSTSYVPIITALSIGLTASFCEEILYRVFLISWGKKLFKSTMVAAIIASIIWGFGHTGYQIYPMWFRGIEVTLLGIFLSIVYLQFGIIPTLVAHYLFDVFWSTAAYLIGHSSPMLFYSSLTVLLLPLALAMVAWFLNRSTQARPLEWSLNKHQKFNLEVIKTHLAGQTSQTDFDWSAYRAKLIAHGWDVAVIDMAYKELKKES